MTGFSLREVVIASLGSLVLLVVLLLGVMGGAMVAGYMSALEPTPHPVEVIHYVPRSPSTPASSPAAAP